MANISGLSPRAHNAWREARTLGVRSAFASSHPPERRAPGGGRPAFALPLSRQRANLSLCGLNPSLFGLKLANLSSQRTPCRKTLACARPSVSRQSRQLYRLFNLLVSGQSKTTPKTRANAPLTPTIACGGCISCSPCASRTRCI